MIGLFFLFLSRHLQARATISIQPAGSDAPPKDRTQAWDNTFQWWGEKWRWLESHTQTDQWSAGGPVVSSKLLPMHQLDYPQPRPPGPSTQPEPHHKNAWGIMFVDAILLDFTHSVCFYVFMCSDQVSLSRLPICLQSSTACQNLQQHLKQTHKILLCVTSHCVLCKVICSHLGQIYQNQKKAKNKLTCH